MIDIEIIKSEIIKRLSPLNPDKVILFGSYAYGTPSKDSDIDLFLIKDDLDKNNFKDYTLKARKLLRDIIFNYDTNGIDIITSSSKYLENREDYFYKVDILKNGKVLYERNSK
ncbi:MAG: nucleotidyltransferase domain-containing protein [Sphaerochaetaceae bacterium]|nr:nucleotidyltransferase domain-containing protein [Sphaerochaetaceae bacterium]